MIVRRLCDLLLVCSTLFSISAQTIEVCTEETLRTAVHTGGSFSINCGTNVITLNSPLVISRPTSLIATQEVVISGQNLTRLFVVQPGASLHLEGIALFSGRMTETNFNDGGIPSTAGGAIYNDGGTVTIVRGRFDSHTVIGTVGRSGEQGERGEDGGDAAGAAIFNNGGLITVSNTSFLNNTATAGLGGKGGNGRGGLGSSGAAGGNGGAAGGAAIYSQGGTVRIFNSVFTNNAVNGALAGAGGLGTGLFGFHGEPGEPGDAVGAAVAGSSGEIEIFNSSFVNNKAKAADGANGRTGVSTQEGGRGKSGGDAAGGAVYATGRIIIQNSTFFSNSATSGKGGNGGAGGSSGFGQDGGDGGHGGMASGGAVESTTSGRIIHCTFSDNTLVAGAGGQGGPGSGLGKAGDPGAAGLLRGAALHGAGGMLETGNSIFAASIPTLAGTIVDLGGNLSSDANSLLNPNISFRGRSPGLRALANNGGPTPTMALQTNSISVDNGAANLCLLTDQRGSNRVNRCDIGAFELVPPATPVPTNITMSAVFRTNTVFLRWPAAYSNNVFVETSTTIPSTNWVPLPVTPRLSSTNLIAEFSPTNSARQYFRLNSTNAVPAGASQPQFPGLPN